MSKRQKRLAKIRNNPKNVSLDDIKRLLEDFGFELDHVTGSHHLFRLKIGDLVLRVNIPFARPIKSRYIKEALKAIEQVQEVQNEPIELEEDNDESD